MAQKYIINDRTLVIGHVEYHSELLNNHDKTIGGGYWSIDEENKAVYLYSKSIQFKAPKATDVIECIKFGMVPPSLEGYHFYFSKEESLQYAKVRAIKIV
jgi:hypothetical protein